MKRVSFLSQHLVKFVPLATLGVCFVLTLTGCPGGAELEHPEAYGLTGGSTSSSGTGGSSPGTGGSGTGGGGMLTVDCGSTTYQAVLTSCAGAGCHQPIPSISYPGAAALDLTPDSGLVGRLKDVKATHGDISCPPSGTTCVPAACDTNALLVNSNAPANSWLLAKINGNSNGCGDAMPLGTSIPTTSVTCLENFVNAVAALPK